MGRKIAAAVSIATLTAGAFTVSPAATASAETGPITAQGAYCKGYVCLSLATGKSKKGKKYIVVKHATVQRLGISEGAVMTMKYSGRGHKTQSHTIRCTYGVCAWQFRGLNFTYRKGTTVCGQVIKSGYNEGKVCHKL
jgi:hypothetical protein